MFYRIITFCCVVALLLVSGCTGSYHHSPDNTYAKITASSTHDRSILQPLTFSCYLIDSNDVVYRVRYEQDCIRFRSGINYTIEQDYEQYIVYAERE